MTDAINRHIVIFPKDVLMIVSLALIVAGFVLLMGGAEYAVRGAVAIANKLHIPTMIIGLTIVAFGTSAPEFVVSISAALNGSAGISIGNIVGSNIANLMLILGAAALIYPVSCQLKIFLRDYAFLLLVTVLFIAFALGGTFVRWQGVIMLALLAAFIVYNYRNSKHDQADENASSPLTGSSWLIVFLVTAAGMAAIIYGADLLVGGAVRLARLLGVSEEIIGLTVIAFGTSLPELATTGMAAYRRQNDVALGNIVGSNIWNIVFIMGATASITDVPVAPQILRYDVWVMLGATLLLLPMMCTRGRLSRPEGLFYLLGYCAYIASLVMISHGYFSFLN